MPEDLLDVLCRELEFAVGEVNTVDGPLDLSGLWGVFRLDRPDLKDEAWTPVVPPAFARTEGTPDLFRVLRSRDVLVHHPYESFASSVEAFVEQAARDPKVLAIKQTLYRTGGAESTIINALVRAADAGKQVVALVDAVPDGHRRGAAVGAGGADVRDLRGPRPQEVERLRAAQVGHAASVPVR